MNFNLSKFGKLCIGLYLQSNSVKYNNVGNLVKLLNEQFNIYKEILRGGKEDNLLFEQLRFIKHEFNGGNETRWFHEQSTIFKRVPKEDKVVKLLCEQISSFKKGLKGGIISSLLKLQSNRSRLFNNGNVFIKL